MNEENNNQNLSGEGEDSSPVLGDELESLRATFQEQYDETVASAAQGPVIQELEDGEDADDEEDDDNTDVETSSAVIEKAPKKKRKAGKITAITVAVLLVVLVVGSLIAYVVASVSNPNFSSFISTYAQASAAETYDDRIKYLEDALKYCSDEESVFQQAMAATIHEEIVVATYNEKGYLEAYSYMQSKMSDEQIANPVSGDFKKIVKVLNNVKSLSLEVFGKVFENIGDSETAPEADVLSAGLDIPDELKETFNSILDYIADGYIANKKSTGINDALVAINYYGNAYSGLLSLGADERALAEKICVVLYNEGFIVESAVFSSVAVDPSKENVNDDYTAVKEELSVFGDTGISVITLAESAVKDEKTDSADILALVKERTSFEEDNAKVIASFVEYAVEAIKSEEENNLTKASSEYATLTSVLDAFGMADVAVHLKTASVILKLGNLSDASTLVGTYLTDEFMSGATEEEKQLRDNMNAIFEGLNAASEVFSPYYAEYYQYGTAMDYDKVSEELDALIKDDSSDYLKGFVAYCKYFAAISSESDVNRKSLIDEMATLMPDLPFVYGYYYIDECIQNNNYTGAVNYAQQLLAVNKADEYANSIVALSQRINGDFDAAIETALKGIELAGTTSDCGKQLAIAYMLKGDFDSAFGYLLSFYSNSMSIDSCDLILVFNKLYEGSDEEIKTNLAAVVSEIEQTYSYYGVTSYADTTAIINGEKTLEDVFMKGNYDLSDE